MDWAAVAYTAAALLCAAAATVITLGHIYRHLLHYAEPIFQRFIVRIIFMVPVYALFRALAPPRQICRCPRRYFDFIFVCAENSWLRAGRNELVSADSRGRLPYCVM